MAILSVFQPVLPFARLFQPTIFTQCFQHTLQLAAAAMHGNHSLIDRMNGMIWLHFVQIEQQFFFQCLHRDIHGGHCQFLRHLTQGKLQEHRVIFQRFPVLGKGDGKAEHPFCRPV